MFLYLLIKIDQIDPISLDLIAFYIHQLIVLKIMLYIFADRVIRKEGWLLNDVIRTKNSLQYFLMQ